MSKQDRRQNLAKRLAIWSISDQIDLEKVDAEVDKFSQSALKKVDEMKEIKKQIEELEKKRKDLAKELIESCSENIKEIQKQTDNNIAKPLVDLAFWNRLSDLDRCLYQIIHPYLDEIGDEESN